MKGYNVRNLPKQWLHTCVTNVSYYEKKTGFFAMKTVDEEQKLTHEKKISAELRSSKCFQLYILRSSRRHAHKVLFLVCSQSLGKRRQCRPSTPARSDNSTNNIFFILCYTSNMAAMTYTNQQ